MKWISSAIGEKFKWNANLKKLYTGTITSDET